MSIYCGHDRRVRLCPLLAGTTVVSLTTSQVIWGGVVECLLSAYFIGNFLPKMSKSIHVCQSYSKPKVGRFLRHGVVFLMQLPSAARARGKYRKQPKASV